MNPRAAINDLHPFQGCPFGQLGYFSRAARTRAIFCYTLEKEFLRILFLKSDILSSGEDGIRTHVPLRTNGFQDRLVMTTSIPLHTIRLNQNIRDIIIFYSLCQYLFSFFYDTVWVTVQTGLCTLLQRPYKHDSGVQNFRRKVIINGFFFPAASQKQTQPPYPLA